MCAIFFATGTLLGKPVVGILEAGPRQLEGTVLSRPHALTYGGQSCMVGTSLGDIQLLAKEAPWLAFGQGISMKGDLAPGEEGWAMRPPVMRATSVLKLHDAPAVLSWSEVWRDSFARFAGRNLPSREAQSLEGMLFSSPDLLERERLEEFRMSGSLQLLTAAGLHVLLIALGLQALFGLLPVPRWLQMVLLALALAFFAMASGFHASVIRASLVALAVRAAPLFKREPDLLSALGLAAVLILLWRPGQVFELGFQLTFTAAAAFALFRGTGWRSPKTAVKALTQRGLSTLKLAGLATLAITPILVQRNHLLVAQSLIAGLLASIALPATLSLAFCSHLVSLLSPAAGGWALAHLTGPLLGWIEGAASWTAAAAWARVETPPFSGYWLALLYGLCLTLWRPSLRDA